MLTPQGPPLHQEYMCLPHLMDQQGFTVDRQKYQWLQLDIQGDLNGILDSRSLCQALPKLSDWSPPVSETPLHR